MRQSEKPDANESSKTREQRMRTTQNLRKMLPWGISIFIVILLFILFFLLRNFNTPEAQAEILSNAVKNNDTQRIATILSTRENKVSTYEAEAYIKYIKSEIGQNKFDTELQKTIRNLDQNDKDASFIKTPDGNKILRITKNGRRFIFFDNISFTTITKKPIIKPKMKTTYIFKADDRKRKVIAESNESTMLGNFIPGNYKIQATKETVNGKFNGHLTFSFKNSNSETVDVHEDFPEANLNIKLDGADQLESKHTKVKINGKSYNYDHTRLYGPYPVTGEIEVAAEGKVKDKSFESDSVKIYPKELKENTPVTLHFEKDKIKKYVDEKEKEENSLKNKLSRFFDKYSSALNDASTTNHFASVSPFLKTGTEHYKQTQQLIQTGQGAASFQQTPQVVDVTTEGAHVYADVLYLNNQGVWVKSTYKLLDENHKSGQTPKADDLKIISSQS
ncbi:TcaA NTF2-like domain-containing protein [Staphylococcus simulans]